MSILNNVGVLIQSGKILGGRWGVKIGVIIKKNLEIFFVMADEKKVGVNLMFGGNGEKVQPTNISEKAIEPQRDLLPTKTENFPGTSIPLSYMVLGITSLLFFGSFVEVLYASKSQNNHSYANVLIPFDFDETDDYSREFHLEFLIPTATFPQENFIENIFKKSTLSEKNIFHSFLFYQRIIISISQKTKFLIISLLIFQYVLKLTELIIHQIFPAQFTAQNPLLVFIIIYPLTLITTNQFTIIISTLFKLITQIVFYFFVYIIHFVLFIKNSINTSITKNIVENNTVNNA